MSHVYESAVIHIMDWLHRAERDLVGHSIKTFTGRMGIVREVRLDEHHGLCFTIATEREHGEPERRWYPVATIKVHGPKEKA
jgi:hypothetical protein